MPPAHGPPSPSTLPTAKRMRPSFPDENGSPPLPQSADAVVVAAVPIDPVLSAEVSPDEEAASANGVAGNPNEGMAAPGANGGSKLNQSSNFRNVSACNRCRLRKNRCDQRLPSCISCEKAGVACVGYDPITKREIPRSYVYYLETRVGQLETLLRQNNIAFPPASELEHSSTARSPSSRKGAYSEHGDGDSGGGGSIRHHAGDDDENSSGRHHASSHGHNHGYSNHREPTTATGRIQKLVARAHQTREQGTSNPHHLGATTGVSFARVVFAAVQQSVSDQRSVSDRANIRPYKPAIAGNGTAGQGTSMRDSFFGLHTKPTIHPAVFPDRELGYKLVCLYFEHANPQIPVLHRGDFMQMFEQAYAEEGRVRGPKELYMLNMVFAIGGGIILGDHAKTEDNDDDRASKQDDAQGVGTSGSRLRQCQPEEYHASAIVHLEACLSNSGGGLEELQAVLLLANFALLRPVPPGLWYIIGVAVRLAVDLGLYYEDGKDGDAMLPPPGSAVSAAVARERGRREYVRDLRRRLWWCTYSFDRLVSVCVGRPPGVSDLVMTTKFPSLLDDSYITPDGFLREEHDPSEPTYKCVAHHYFRLRLLQSEIVQVLQYQQAQLARVTSSEERYPFPTSDLPSPYLAKHDSFRSWRMDVDRRLHRWKITTPAKPTTGVAFSTEFLELNYWQCIIMLYRQSLSVPPMFEGEYHTSNEVNSNTTHQSELREDEDRVYVKVAEAGQRILRLYRQLHLIGLVNYTYLATHHLFMAGISYLYAIWHSPIVRSRLTMDEVDFTILAATSVFTDMIEKCPPAEACRDAFDRTAKATVKMANSTGGFGQPMPQPAYVQRQRSNSKGNADSQRLDWGFSPVDLSPSLSTKSAGGGGSSGAVSGPGATGGGDQTTANHHRHQKPPRPAAENSRQRQYQQFQQQQARQRFDGPTSDAYSSGAALPAQMHQQYRGPTSIKMEGETYAMMQAPPSLSRNNTGPYETIDTPNSSPTIGQQVMSPNRVHVSPIQGNSMNGTPTTPNAPVFLDAMQQQQQHQHQQRVAQQQAYRTAQPFTDMQGIEFLQSLTGGGSGAGPMAAGMPSGMVGDQQQMDFGLNFGWEGMHHDFNDGQQLDLFDGFFFGGQQGGGGGPM